jgi:voltage-gated potassium channel Kch
VHATPANRAGHVIVCGTDHLGRRIVEQLLLRHERVIVITPTGSETSTVPAEAEIVAGDCTIGLLLASTRAGLAEVLELARTPAS